MYLPLKMTDIWNLNALCRCCHSDGLFKSLQTPYVYKNNVEVYSAMLQEAFGVIIKLPPFDASFMICDECVTILRAALQFKKKVLECEKKFEEYCKNEQSLCPISDVKIEINSYTSDVDDSDHYEPPITFHQDNEIKTDDKVKLKFTNLKGTYEKEQKMEKDGTTEKMDVTDNKIDIKNVDIKLEDTKDKKVEVTIDSSDAKIKSTKKTGVLRKTANARSKCINQKPMKTEESREKVDPNLILHIKRNKKDVYKCKLCKSIFKKESYMKRHILSTHVSPKQYKCDHCPRVFRHISKLKIHLTQHGEKKYDCQYCDKKYTDMKFLSEHLNTHTREKVFTCHFCSKSFLYKQILRRHIRLHLGTSKTHMCDICGNSFNDKTQVAIHVRTVHEKIRPYTCNICQKSYAANKTLKVHYRKHTGETPYKCDECPQAFISNAFLKRHKLEHSPVTDPPIKYRCKVCRKTFAERGRFAAHVRKHAGEKPLVCSICTKDFTCKYTLKRHIDGHYGIKPYSCEICQNRFTQKFQLTRHMDRLHNPNRVKGEKKKCELCKRNVYNWEKHLETHNKKPYACALCDKMYAEKNGLNRHVRIVHEGLRPHMCYLCGKKYAKATSLTRHMFKAHKDVKHEGDETLLPIHSITKQDC